jgi:hypothetical protein
LEEINQCLETFEKKNHSKNKEHA